MNTTDVFDAPALQPQAATSKWEQEYGSFLRMLPQLLQTHRGAFVAIHQGQVVGFGSDKLQVAREAYRKFGPVDILVRLVTDKPPRVVRIPTPTRNSAGDD